MRILASSPTNARFFLLADVYGLGTHTPAGDAFVQTIYSGLYDFNRGINSASRGPKDLKLNVAFAQFSDNHLQPGKDRLDECVARGRVRAAAVYVRDEETARVRRCVCEPADLGQDDLSSGLKFRLAVSCARGQPKPRMRCNGRATHSSSSRSRSMW